jgi:hypothetical protein
VAFAVIGAENLIVIRRGLLRRYLTPARLATARCRRSGILRGDECVALVTEPDALLGLCAHFHQLVGSLLDAPAALCGHHAPEEIGHAVIRAVAFLRGWSTRYKALIVRPGPLAFGFGKKGTITTIRTSVRCKLSLICSVSNLGSTPIPSPCCLLCYHPVIR